VLIDPFAGTGAIGRARLMIGRSAKIILSDADEQRAAALKRTFRPPLFEVARWDALALQDTFAAGRATELATDPPWGLFAPLPTDGATFYKSMLASFAHALKAGGHLALLTADKAAFGAALGDSAAFETDGRIDVLINGKKAAIFTAERV
jgi:tRNA G10  N-methylase Trm11